MMTYKTGRTPELPPWLKKSDTTFTGFILGILTIACLVFAVWGLFYIGSIIVNIRPYCGIPIICQTPPPYSTPVQFDCKRDIDECRETRDYYFYTNYTIMDGQRRENRSRMRTRPDRAFEDIENLLSQANDSFANGKFKKARSIFKEVYEKTESLPVNQYWRSCIKKYIVFAEAKILQKKGEYSLALEKFNELSSSSPIPDCDIGQLSLIEEGITLKYMLKPESAMKKFRRALEISEFRTYTLIYKEMANVISMYDGASPDFFNYLSLALNYADHLHDSGSFRSAKKNMKAEIYLLLATGYNDKGDKENALEQLITAKSVCEYECDDMINENIEYYLKKWKS